MSLSQGFALSRRILLILLDAFLALTATAGGIGLVGGGAAPPLEMLQGSPFRSFVIPGLALLILVGGSGLAATILTFYRHQWGAPVSAIAGVMIMGFEIVEVMVIGSPMGLARTLQIFYFAVGLCMVALAAFVWEGEQDATLRQMENRLHKRV
jgi:hypothetical protein